MTRSGDRLYHVLLRCYPADFRAQYGRAMTDFHRDRVAVARSAGDSMAILWLRTVADIVTSAAAEHWRALLSSEVDMNTIMHDARFAARSLGRRPAFTATVIATIALGIGANVAIFSVVSGILLRPLPYPRAEQLFSFGHEPPQWLTSDPNFVDYRKGMHSLSGLAAYINRPATLTTGDTPQRIQLVRASEDFLPVLGVAPEIGRAFDLAEYAPRLAQVIVLSHSLWERSFGADPHIVGKTVRLEGVARTVVGIMPAGFGYPNSHIDAWMPLARFNPDSLGDRANNYLFMVGRLRPGVALEAARAEANGIARGIMLDYPEKFDPKRPLVPHLTSVTEDLVGNTRPYLLTLLGAVGFVLLIVCANVANLLLMRGEGRRKEMALRSALGASGGRLATGLMTESVLLAAAGGALGLALAWAADRLLVAVAPASIPRLADIGVDGRVLAFTTFVAMLTGILVGSVPAWRVLRGNVAEALKDGTKTVASHGSSHVMRGSLVVAEVTLAVVMLTGAGMLLRSLWHLQNAGLGFESHGVLTANVSISPREYNDARAIVFYDQLVSRIQQLPGVRAAGASGWLPVVDAGGLWGFQPEGGNYPDGRWPEAVPQQVTPGYFSAVGIPLIAGRDVAVTDREGTELVAVVSKKFAELAWPGTTAVGRRFKLGGSSPLMTVVGIVGDIRARGFGDIPEPTMYFPHAQTAKSAYFVPRAMSLLVRVNDDPLALAGAVRQVVQSLDRNAPVSDVRTLEQVAGTSVATRRFNTALLAGFAMLALVLAGIGTYGVISYGVTQRTFEIGVRMALGAGDRSVLTLIMSEGMRLCAIGLTVGLFASLALERWIRALLVDIPAVDVPTLVATSMLLAAVAVTASVIPARRALKVSPLDALRG